jgi:drug/metabolite transporter (DMT)-like permease
MPRSATFPLVAVVSWGFMFAVISRALHHVDAFNFSALRYGLGALALAGILVAREGWSALRPGGRTVELAVLGAAGFAGFNLLGSLALGRTAPQNAALVVALTPLLTVLVAWARDRVRPRPVTLVLIGAALLGVLLVITKGRLTALSAFGAGDLLMLGAVTGWAMYTQAAGRFTHLSPLRYATVTALTGTATILVLTVLADAFGWQHPPSVPDVVAIWPELGYVALVGSVLAILAWNTGIRRLGAPNAALFMNLVPVVALALAAAQGYRVHAAELAGTALTAAAIVTANLLNRRTAPVRAVAAVTPDQQVGSDRRPPTKAG